MADRRLSPTMCRNLALQCECVGDNAWREDVPGVELVAGRDVAPGWSAGERGWGWRALP